MPGTPSCPCTEDSISYKDIVTVKYAPPSCATLDFRPSALASIGEVQNITALAFQCVEDCHSSWNAGWNATVPTLPPRGPPQNANGNQRSLESYFVTLEQPLFYTPVNSRLQESCNISVGFAELKNDEFLSRYFTSPIMVSELALHDTIIDQFFQTQQQFAEGMLLRFLVSSSFASLRYATSSDAAILVSRVQPVLSGSTAKALREWGINTSVSSADLFGVKTSPTSTCLTCAAECHSGAAQSTRFYSSPDTTALAANPMWSGVDVFANLQSDGEPRPCTEACVGGGLQETCLGPWEWFGMVSDERSLIGLEKAAPTSDACKAVSQALTNTLEYFDEDSQSPEFIHIVRCETFSIKSSSLGRALDSGGFESLWEAWNEGFDKNWTALVDHRNYFSACKPAKCTVSVARKRTIWELILAVVATMGGIQAVLRGLAMLALRLVDPRPVAVPTTGVMQLAAGEDGMESQEMHDISKPELSQVDVSVEDDLDSVETTTEDER
eukprot:TRINITY_DN57757_c0_g1_i1.p1 TRINITY_DN57757_c0_g1~~TRINITY_DN57757_c0_g1_i1.p1  ORF type:complete len:563 (-),score=72.74 TRINITY_DN57757_c0_g1_i1:19-1512(-)